MPKKSPNCCFGCFGCIQTKDPILHESEQGLTVHFIMELKLSCGVSSTRFECRSQTTFNEAVYKEILFSPMIAIHDWKKKNC